MEVNCWPLVSDVLSSCVLSHAFPTLLWAKVCPDFLQHHMRCSVSTSPASFPCRRSGLLVEMSQRRMLHLRKDGDFPQNTAWRQARRYKFQLWHLPSSQQHHSVLCNSHHCAKEQENESTCSCSSASPGGLKLSPHQEHSQKPHLKLGKEMSADITMQDLLCPTTQLFIDFFH